MLELAAYAKINLSLEVVGRRPDGYHDLVSVMQLVDLHDALRLERAAGISFESDDPAMLAEGEGNLVLRAARLLREAAQVDAGARITLLKRIPASGGLGGGSSDAAATLTGLSRLWGLRLTTRQLSALGSQLGSDVPFFFAGPTALVEGRGERVTPLPAAPAFEAVLVSQPYDIPAKTRLLYSRLTPADMSDGAFTHSLAEALAQGQDITALPLRNTFERAAYDVFPGLADIRRQVLAAGAPNVHLSGSGPTLFALYPPAATSEAHNLHAALQSRGLRAYHVRSRE